MLSGGAVAGHAETYLPSLLQAKPAAFAQLRAVARDPSRLRVVAFLRDQAVRLWGGISY